MGATWEDELLDDSGDGEPDAEALEPRILALLEGRVYKRDDPEEKGRIVAIVDVIFPHGTLWLEPAQRGFLPPSEGERVLILFKQGRKEYGIYWPLGVEENADQRVVRGDALWAWMQSVSPFLQAFQTWGKDHVHPDPVSGLTGTPNTLPPAAPASPNEADILSERWRIR
jgi:hypothetical protein